MKKLTPSCALTLIAFIAALPGTALAENGSGPGDPPAKKTTAKKGALASSSEHRRNGLRPGNGVAIAGGTVAGVTGVAGATRSAVKATIAHMGAVEKRTRVEAAEATPEKLTQLEATARKQNLDVWYSGDLTPAEQKLETTTDALARFHAKRAEIFRNKGYEAGERVRQQVVSLKGQEGEKLAQSYQEALVARNNAAKEEAYYARASQSEDFRNRMEPGRTDAELKAEVAERTRTKQYHSAQLDLYKRQIQEQFGKKRAFIQMLDDGQDALNATDSESEHAILTQKRSDEVLELWKKKDVLSRKQAFTTIRLKKGETLASKLAKLKLTEVDGKKVLLYTHDDAELLKLARQQGRLTKLKLGGAVIGVGLVGWGVYDVLRTDEKRKEIEADMRTPSASSQVQVRDASHVE